MGSNSFGLAQGKMVKPLSTEDSIILNGEVFGLPQVDPHEQAFREYQHERWMEDPTTWAPLITLEQLEKRPDLEIEWYCHPKGTKILMSNLSWLNIEQLQIGDEIVGFDEEKQNRQGANTKSRRFRASVVEGVQTRTQRCLRINTSEGTVQSSLSHKWLTVQRGKRQWARWVDAKDLRAGDKLYLMNSPWLVDNTISGGYLRGILDGEGSITNGNISVSQNPGIVLDTVEEILKEKGYTYTKQKHNGDATWILKFDLPNSRRLLGQIRPHRLLLKQRPSWEGRGVFAKGTIPTPIVEIEDIGETEVVSLQTSSKTLIANGFLSHNCPDWIPVGAKTILSAEPKTGKTILLFHILKAVTEGGEFLGKPCPPTRVLYLTEQTEQEFKKQVCEVRGLIGNPNFYVLLAEETPPEHRTWEDTLEFCEKMLAHTKAKILVVDTFGGLAKLPPNGENDAATIQNQINKLNYLFKNRYLSVVLTHHNRKKSEERFGTGSNLSISAARGSSAFVGGGGHLIFMDDPTRGKGVERKFNFFGRYMHGKEKTLYLVGDNYQETQFNWGARK
jgi:hypothetical protein